MTGRVVGFARLREIRYIKSDSGYIKLKFRLQAGTEGQAGLSTRGGKVIPALD